MSLCCLYFVFALNLTNFIFANLKMSFFNKIYDNLYGLYLKKDFQSILIRQFPKYT